MGKVKGKHRLDKFYHLAKEQGFRSRASFKLLQLDAKYSFLHSAHAVLDLCAAPGGWMQVAVQKVPVGSLVIGVDLFPIRPIRGAISFEEDITKPKCRAMIKKLLGERGVKAFDVVLHDGSPNVGGAWAKEATSQTALVIDSVKLATEFLAPKGTFVTKVFRSQDYNAVLYCLRQLFDKVEVTKPTASRSTSAEIFVVALRYKAPAKIDPRLLDVKHLFQGAVEPPRKINVLEAGSKRERNRGGYEDGISIMRKVCSAADFVWLDTPLDVLGTVTSISFDDPDSKPIKENSSTTEEVKALCDDLGVLGKQDFKHLLKWRMNIRQALTAARRVPSTTMDLDDKIKDDTEEGDNKDENEDGDSDEEEDKVLNEMEELTSAVDRKKKREKKLIAKRHAKEKARKALGVQIDATVDDYTDHDLFSLASIKGKKDLAVVDAPENIDEDVENADSDDEEYANDVKDDNVASDADSDEERKRYDDQIENVLDEAYEQYVSKKEGSTKQRKRAKQTYEEAERLEDIKDEEEIPEPEYDSDKEEDTEANPLMVPISEERPPTEEEMTKMWFSQDIFAEAVEDGDLGAENDDSDDEMQVDEQVSKALVPKITDNTTVNQKNTTVKQKDTTVKQKNTTVKQASSEIDRPKNKASKADDDDFEIVPAPETDSSDDSSSDDESDLDVDTKAEILAYAKKMLHKKQRDQIIDDGYNKYMFDDEGLPKWFLEEEMRHRQPMKPITKEEVNAMKAQFKEINARPAKKVAEAKARKKKAVMRKLEKIRKKANMISDQSDIPDRSKSRMIEQLYKKGTAAPQKPKKELVVAKKGVQVRAGKGKVLVDRRMKKDKRQAGMSKQGGRKGKSAAKGKKGKGGPVKAGGKRGKKGN